MTRNIYKDFDLPNKHLNGETDYIPPKARDEDEIDRRRSNPNGTLLLEYQDKGIVIARAILNNLRSGTENDIDFSSNILAASGLNTAWYSYGRNAPVQRRRLKLEVLATDDVEQRPSSYMLLCNAIDDLGNASKDSELLIGQHITRNPEAIRQQTLLGRIVGHAALTLSCVPIGDRIGYEDTYLTDFDLQDLARKRGLSSLETARELAVKIGSAPSFAQLTDPDSDLSVYWRRQAPNGALEAYTQAFEEAA